MRGEDALQASICNYLDRALPDRAVYFAVPNGGSRRPVEAKIFKATGVKAGVPDLIVIQPGLTVGLEVKTAKGRVKPEQRDMLERFNKAGALTAVVRSIEDVQEALESAGVPLKAKVMA